MITALDTNIILDIVVPDTADVRTSKALLERAGREGALVICEVVYAEVAARFQDGSALDFFMQETRIRLSASTPEALAEAGVAWTKFASNRRRKVQCGSCGREQDIVCIDCSQTISFRQRVLADFLIGGHALLQADRLLTRDQRYFRTYFATLKLGPELDPSN
ncbi:MAG: type II toxin-antitoxin system VapC family toxin [SAR202 cluster bacterium]|nr:type II toxin-antitoxin system VapC family toxin [SAR202 cluster bacterium]